MGGSGVGWRQCDVTEIAEEQKTTLNPNPQIITSLWLAACRKNNGAKSQTESRRKGEGSPRRLSRKNRDPGEFCGQPEFGADQMEGSQRQKCVAGDQLENLHRNREEPGTTV